LASVLFVGCGDIASRLAPLLADRFSLFGLRRNPYKLPEPVVVLQGDVCDVHSLELALDDRLFDYVVITLTPGQRTDSRYREVYVEGTRNVLNVLRGNPRVLFVSSTSVYGQHQGEWVNEHTPALGDGFSGQRLLEAERLVLAGTFPATCIRFSGIYGPGRERLLRQMREGTVDTRLAAQYSNRIHADDAARVLAFVIDRWVQGHSPASCYVASDTRPVQMGEVWQWLAECMAVPAPYFPDTWKSANPSGKRCDSKQLQKEGFIFQYPDFCAGYSSLLAR
jgi:nucleoside-diphosphate-sugar epimerase